MQYLYTCGALSITKYCDGVQEPLKFVGAQISSFWAPMVDMCVTYVDRGKASLYCVLT